MMKHFKLPNARRAGLSLVVAFGAVVFAVAQQKYVVRVDTYVGSKLEDRYSFLISEGEKIKKGFESRILAKKYLTDGFENSHSTLRKKNQKKDPDKTKTATPLQTANELLKSLSMEMDSKRIEIDSSHLKFEKMVEQKAILEKIINSYRGNPQKMSEAIAKYKAMYNIEDVDPEVAKILKNAPKSGVDFDRIELGSYCELEMSGSFPQGVTISGILAYSRIKYWFYADGDKVPSGGKISKFPRIEFFEREIKADIPFGKKYCVQFARGGSEESGSLEDAISKSSIFNMGTLSPFVIKTDSEKGANASGLLEEIEKKFGPRSSDSARIEISVSPFKG